MNYSNIRNRKVLAGTLAGAVASVLISCSAQATLLINITPRLGFNRYVPQPDRTIEAAAQRWHAWFAAAPQVAPTQGRGRDLVGYCRSATSGCSGRRSGLRLLRREPGPADLDQTGTLAGLVQVPSTYDPIDDLSTVRLRQRHILNRLVVTKVLSGQ